MPLLVSLPLLYRVFAYLVKLFLDKLLLDPAVVRYLDSLLLLPKFLVLVIIVPAAGFVIVDSDVNLKFEILHQFCSVSGRALSLCFQL